MSFKKILPPQEKMLPPGGSELAIGNDGHEYKKRDLPAPINCIPTAEKGHGPVLGIVMEEGGCGSQW